MGKARCDLLLLSLLSACAADAQKAGSTTEVNANMPGLGEPGAGSAAPAAAADSSGERMTVQEGGPMPVALLTPPLSGEMSGSEMSGSEMNVPVPSQPGDVTLQVRLTGDGMGTFSVSVPGRQPVPCEQACSSS